LEGMKRLPDESIDLIIVDPPYGILKKEYKFENFEASFPTLWLTEIERTMKEGASLYCFYSQFHIPVIQPLIERHLKLRNVIVWYYPNIAKGYQGLLNGKHCYRKQWQPIFFATKNNPSIRVRTKWKRYASNNYDVIKCAVPQSNFKKDKRFMKMQKPLELVKRLLIASSEEKNIILDPFMGSGTTAVACKQLSRHYIGFEINPEYCEIAKKRLSEVQLELI